MWEKLRIWGSLGAITGQFVLLFHSRIVGLCILLACSTMSMPYFLRKRYYDIVLVMALGMGINFAGIFLGNLNNLNK